MRKDADLNQNFVSICNQMMTPNWRMDYGQLRAAADDVVKDMRRAEAAAPPRRGVTEGTCTLLL